jgi:hypothetical protein
MAGRAPRGSRDFARSCHRASSSVPRTGASAAGRGVAGTFPTTAEPELDRTRATLPTHRALVRKGLTVAEAANLTAYLCGIPLGDVQWSLPQINRLLFLRELHRTGRIGESIDTPTVAGA